ncbi:MAG: hypothetical protein HBSAPP03_03450 [Phycisphaerae bacterium]|nr:MAG: hypothetical protein HBSAPP03_03450 [Phycisphaerae bacterium]
MPDPPPQGEVPRSSAAEGDAAPFDRAAHDRQVPQSSAAEGDAAPFDRAAHDRQVPRPAAAEGESTPTPTPSTGSRASTPAPTFPPFTPDPATADAILRDLGDPDLSFRAVAELRGTSLEALAAWFARPDIAQRAAQIESAIARRARFVAIASLTTAAKAMQTILADFLDGVHLRVDDPDAHPGLPAPRNTELLRRQAETARKAAAILLRIARFDSTLSRQAAVPSAIPSSPSRHEPPDVSPSPAADSPREHAGPSANVRYSAVTSSPSPSPASMPCDVSPPLTPNLAAYPGPVSLAPHASRDPDPPSRAVGPPPRAQPTASAAQALPAPRRDSG